MAFAYIVEASAQGLWAEPSGTGNPTGYAIRKGIQTELKRIGRYSGPADGAWGPNTIKGIQRSIAAGKYYSGPIDGAVGKNTCRGVELYSRRSGGGLTSGGGWNNIIWNGFWDRLKGVPKEPKPLS